MKYFKEVGALFIILAALSTPLVFAGYEENIREDIFLVRPDNTYITNLSVPIYLDDEDLTFFACLEADNVPVRLSVLCEDTNEFVDVPAMRWGEENCFIGSVNLEGLECANAVVQADYVAEGENLKLSRQIRINKFSSALNRIVETQFTDGGWETPLDTAYGLFVLNHFPEIFPRRIDSAIEYLKLNRNEQEKCWPKDTCKISTTANILYLLDKADLEDYRIQHDAYLYLEKKQNYITTSDNWTVSIQDYPLNINNTINTSCVFDYESSLSTFSLQKYPAIRNITIDPEYLSHIGIACTENIIVTLYNEFDEQLIGYQGDNFSYDIPGACWTINNENIQCDLRTTLYGISTGITANQRAAARQYLESLIVEDRTAGRHLTSNWSVYNDALFLHGSTSSSAEFITGLLFQQANNGTWVANQTYYRYADFEVSAQELSDLQAEISDSISRNIITTGYVVMALLERNYDREDEPILDAEKWVSLVEDKIALNYTDEDLEDEDQAEEFRTNRSLILNDTKRNAMAFYVLQNNARPLLRTEPRIISMNEKTIDIDIINPTIFELEGLTYEFSSDIEPLFDIEEKDYVGSYSFRRVTLTLTDENAEDDIGYLRILKGDDEYMKLPIILESQPSLNITLPEQLTVFGSTAILPFKVIKTSHDFTCSLTWTTEGVSSASSFNINSLTTTDYKFPIRFAILETENAVYEGDIVCTANQVTFNIPFATNIVRFTTRPLGVQPNIVTINESGVPQIITVRNLLDESIDVTAELTESDPFVIISDPFIPLFPGEERNITVEAVPPLNTNYTASNSIVFSTFNVEERVLLNTEIYVSEADPLDFIIIIVIGTVAILLIGVGAFFAYRYREQLMQWYTDKFHKEDIREKIFKEVAQVEQEETREAIRNMMKILKLQGVNDIKIREQLAAEGYTEDDINDALSLGDKPRTEEKS